MAKDINVDRLLERQAKRWEAGRRVGTRRGEASPRGAAHLAEGPWVTISRQIGSRGEETAKLVAERLDWPLYDREILSAIAQHTHTKEKIISRLDEHAVSHLNDLLRNLMVPDDMGQAEFLKELARVVWTLAREGEVIVLGRGANWILNPRFGLRVRLVAPRDVRVQRVAEREGLETSAADKLVRSHDAEQQAFIHQAFGKQIEDPLGYDLVLNAEHVGPDQAAAAIVALLRSKLESRL